MVLIGTWTWYGKWDHYCVKPTFLSLFAPFWFLWLLHSSPRTLDYPLSPVFLLLLQWWVMDYWGNNADVKCFLLVVSGEKISLWTWAKAFLVRVTKNGHRLSREVVSLSSGHGPEQKAVGSSPAWPVPFQPLGQQLWFTVIPMKVIQEASQTENL